MANFASANQQGIHCTVSILLYRSSDGKSKTGTKQNKMKRFLRAGIIITGVIMSAAQLNAQEGFGIGIEGTPQFSWLINSDDRSNASYETMGTLNGSFGVTMQYGFNDMNALGLNVLYSYQGQRFKLNTVERYKMVEYIKIPLLYVYSYGISRNLRFIGKIGPQLDILANARLTDKDGNDIVGDHMDAYNNAALDVVGSAGFGFLLSDNWWFDAAVRYDIGLTNAEDPGYRRNINDPLRSTRESGRTMTNNSTLGLNLGIRYVFAR